MTAAPTVSIIIAAFNAERQIGGALTAALAQSEVAIEVVVADDASTDGTAAVVQGVGDARVRLVRLETNGGPAAARNAAIGVARGEWLAVLDADDTMASSRIAGLLAAGLAGGADIVADNLIVERAGERGLLFEDTLDGGVERLELADYIRHNRLFAAGRGYGYLKPLFRTEFLRARAMAYDPRLRIGEDFDLVARMLALGAVYLRVRSADYVYFAHPQSISHRLSEDDAEAMAAADRRFLAEHEGLSGDAVGAMRAHLRSVEDAAAFARLVEAIKAKHWGKAFAEAARRPSAVRHLGLPVMARLRRRRNL